jgi:hypothetical protein
VPRGIFGPKGEEATEGWCKLQSGELQKLYSSPSIMGVFRRKRVRLEGHIARITLINVHKKFQSENLKGREGVEKPEYREEENIKMCLKVIWLGLDLSDSVKATMTDLSEARS